MEDNSRIAAESKQDDNMRDEQTTDSESPHDWSELMRDATPEQVAAALLRPVSGGDAVGLIPARYR